jgi:tRNA (guanine37-N1)-methyltransferase
MGSEITPVFYVLSLFPEEMKAYFLKGLMKKAFEKKLFQIEFINIRDFSEDKHNKVDDYPFGHKNGLLMRFDVLKRAIESIPNYQDFKIVCPSPKGKSIGEYFSAETRGETHNKYIFICGYYEGVDSRLFDCFDVQEVSVGDFVITSGEMPVMMVVDAIIRQIPGVIGNEKCVEEESILSGLLESSQYTTPREYDGYMVPEVLLNGHHQNIENWRSESALIETLEKRPDLFINNNGD